VELVYTLDPKPSGFSLEGSSPSFGTFTFNERYKFNMCNCKKGRYFCDGIDKTHLTIPDEGHCMSEYKKHRKEAGLSGEVYVDSCLGDEIMFLWNIGIKTGGCCCGHNLLDGFINSLHEEDSIKMKIFGYEVQFNPHNPKIDNTFYPKSVKKVGG
jgi:hypothetical protein